MRFRPAFCFVTICLAGAQTRAANTVFVPDQFPTLQAAVNATSPGDTVIIRPGTYNGTTTFANKNITIQSTDPNDPAVVDATILDGQGAGTVLYNLGLLVEAVTEGHLRQHLERRRMDRDIDRLSGHVVVCGFGRVGRAAAEQLLASGNDVVVVDRDPDRFAEADVTHIVGNVTEDDSVLTAAGIHRARALVASLDSDAETLYLTLSARALAPDLVIVARARTADSKQKLVLAGATRAVNPQMIGGRRLAAFALQPDLAEFIDVVVHDSELDFQIQQVTVHEQSALAGRALDELALLDRTGVQVLAIRPSGTTGFTFRPPGSAVVSAGCVLIGFGTLDGIASLQGLAERR